MLLTIDVGNTNTGAAVFDRDKIVFRNRLMTPGEIKIKFIKSLVKKEFRKKVSHVIISSVVPFVDHSLRQAIEEFFQKGPIFINHETDTGISLKIDNPAEMGADRIADCVGATLLYPPPLIVIDSGTVRSCS